MVCVKSLIDIKFAVFINTDVLNAFSYKSWFVKILLSLKKKVVSKITS